MQFPPELSAYRDALLKIAKPSATFEAVPAPADLDIRASKMGGVPFNPRWTDWPSSMVPDGHLVTKKRPMAFIGQFNFAEIVAAVPELRDVVPSQGLLQLFYDMEEGTWGGNYPEDFNFFHVAWHPDIETLEHVPVEPPVPSFPEQEFALRFSPRLSFPAVTSLPEEIELSEDEEEDYDNALIPESHHQIGGYPLPVQNCPMEDLELGDSENDGRPWQVLLQIDSDPEMDIMWGDTGTIYLGLKTTNLAHADPSQARLVLQCC